MAMTDQMVATWGQLYLQCWLNDNVNANLYVDQFLFLKKSLKAFRTIYSTVHKDSWHLDFVKSYQYL